MRMPFCTTLMTLLTALTVHAGQPLETETARLPAKGTGEFESTVEFQTSSEGHELAIPFALSYGITDRLEVLFEPVVFTKIAPDNAKSNSGVGDIETTLTYRLNDESARLPAFAIAGEIKIPTAKNDAIGTGKADYAAYVIASKRFGDWDTHLNLSYTVLGSPSGISLNNIYGGAAAVEWRPNPKWDFIGEIITSSSAGNEAADNAGAPPP
ncbi:MAG: transporter, partial [Gammaproteobacteria bacterium]